MQSVIRVLQWVFLTVAVVLLLSASVLILNTIRMAIFARRREVSVMKLVGATNWFIRLPFMAEGMIQGLLGAGVAVLVVLALYWGIGLNQGSTAADSNSIIAPDVAERVGGLRHLPAGVGGRRRGRRDRARPSPSAASSTSDVGPHGPRRGLDRAPSGRHSADRGRSACSVGEAEPGTARRNSTPLVPANRAWSHRLMRVPASVERLGVPEPGHGP